MPIQYTPELIAELKDLVTGLPRADGVKAVRKRLKLSERQGRSVYARYMDNLSAIKTVSSHDPISHCKSDETEVTVDNATSIDDVIRVANVDRDTWVTDRFSVGPRPNGGLSWRASFKRNKLATATEAIEVFTKAAAAHAPRKWSVAKPEPGTKDCLYVLNIQDPHLAKLAWGVSTGHGDWDIKIAEQAYRETVDELMAKAPSDRIEEVIVIIGSDMLQIDNERSETTKGTYVESDSRLPKAFDVAAKMLTDVVEKLAARFKVRCIVFPGNHDQVTSFFLGRYVEAWFRTHPKVVIDSSPRSRKYYGYGKTLLGFDHGDETKLKDLPLVMMRENQETISRYLYQEVLTGHLHAEASQDTKGIVVRVAPALCAPDSWHSAKSFVGSMRRSQALLYQRERGLEAIYYSKPLNVTS